MLTFFKKYTQRIKNNKEITFKDHYKNINNLIALQVALSKDDQVELAKAYDETLVATLPTIKEFYLDVYKELKKQQFFFTAPSQSFLLMFQEGFFDKYLWKHPDLKNFIYSQNARSAMSILIDCANKNYMPKEVLKCIRYLYLLNPSYIEPKGNDNYVWNTFKKIPEFLPMIETLKLNEMAQQENNNLNQKLKPENSKYKKVLL